MKFLFETIFLCVFQTSFGGHGYHHVHMNILPRMFAKGLSVEQVEQMTVTNPARWLEFNL